jgi:hypothetical protein
MVLQGRQNIKESMYLGPFQNKILFQNKFLFLFCPPLKYFSLPVPRIHKDQEYAALHLRNKNLSPISQIS